MRKGIYVENGAAMRRGKPYFGMGVNVYSLFNSSFPKEGQARFDLSAGEECLKILSDNGVPFARFNLGGYYWYELDAYMASPAAYREAAAKLAERAQALGIGLVPSFFWLIQCVSDYFGEPMRAGGEKNSKTRDFMRTYTLDMTAALRNFDAVWGWEFGNEFNLGADLPNAAQNRPPLRNGDPRDAGDCITLEDVHSASEEFAALVRGADPDGRFITSGNATLRAGQYTIHRTHEWGTDTEEEHERATRMFHPGCMDVISEHLYFRRERYFGREMNVGEYLGYTMDMCRRMKKPLFLGEFGHNNLTEPEPDEASRERAYEEIAGAIVSAGVPMSLIWNFAPRGGVEYSFTHTERKGKFLFGLLRRCNADLARFV